MPPPPFSYLTPETMLKDLDNAMRSQPDGGRDFFNRLRNNWNVFNSKRRTKKTNHTVMLPVEMKGMIRSLARSLGLKGKNINSAVIEELIKRGTDYERICREEKKKKLENEKQQLRKMPHRLIRLKDQELQSCQEEIRLLNEKICEQEQTIRVC